jgi:hypothetical protein
MTASIIRRILCAALVGALLLGDVRYWTTSDVATLETSLILLLIWCAIFLRVEPILARVALVIVLISFWLTIAFRDSFIKHAFFARAATRCI